MLLADVRDALSDCPIASPERIRQAELDWSAAAGEPVYRLMERAGSAAWTLIRRRFPGAERWLVVAGPGNNGGDAFEVARHAICAGKDVVVAVRRTDDDSWMHKVSGDAAIALAKLRSLRPTFVPWKAIDSVSVDLVVDGLLGSGAVAPPRPEALQAIAAINATGVPVFSLDIPSGLDACTGQPIGDAVRARATLSFVALKPGQVTGDGLEYCGQLAFADLGVGIEAASLVGRLASWSEHRVKRPVRRRNSHKGMFGHLLLIGGNRGMGGAVMLAAESALRTGVGRLTVITRPEHVQPLLARLPEAMVLAGDDPSSSVFEDKFGQAQAILIGPGLGRDAWSDAWCERVAAAGRPTVVDADACHWMSRHPGALHPTAITPHPGEAAMLLNTEVAAIQADRWAALHQLTGLADAVVLKGAGSLVGGAFVPWCCPYGNPGMASAGMGDVLAGVLGSLIAQGMEAGQAAVYATLLHAKAGDEAARHDGMIGTLASDLLPWLRQLQQVATS
jgi:NAD(P)H-hydrate epimerase